MRKAAAQIEAEKVQTTNRMLDEIGFTFDWSSPNSFSSSSSAQIFPSILYTDPNDERIPESSEESEPEGEDSAFDALDQKFVSIFSIVFHILH